MALKIPVLSVKAKLLTLILFLVFILIISGHFLQRAITERIADINQRTALVNVLTDSSESVQINANLYYPLRSVIYDPTDQHRDEYNGHLSDFFARIERIGNEDPKSYALLRMNIDRLVLLAEGRANGDIMANSDAVEQVTDLLMQNDKILRGLKERLEKKLQHHAVSSIHQTETLYFIPFFYVIGGLAVLAFVILIAMMDIFRPVSHVTKAMISASYNPRLARNYLVRMSREDEIGRFAKAFNTLVSEVADNIAKVEQKERQLMESWRYLQAVLDNVVDGIVIMDERGVIESFNPRAREIFGYDEQEAVGKIFQIMHQDTVPVAVIDFLHDVGARAAHSASMPSLLQEDPRELEVRRKDGIMIPAEITVGRAQYNGRLIYIAAVRDISLRRQMEALLEQTQRMETVARMTGGVAHDFNNMLTVISGSLELLERRAGDPEKSKALIESALETVERGRELTQRLLAFSRKQVLQPRLINVNDQMDRMIMLVRSVLPENIEIVQNLAADLGVAQIDPNQLESAILNLALNARDAIAEAGREAGVVEIRTENITVRPSDSAALGNTRPGEYVRIAVRDNGKGIARAVRKRVFDPFFTTKDVGKGTGLGLSMVYGFARQSGGYATVADREREGAEILLYFPRANALEQGQMQMVAEQNQAGEETPTGHERLLLVEDEPHVLDFMTDLLRELGYDVKTARSGPEAIAILDERPALDLVITDIVMPGGLTGEDVAARAAETCPNAKVLYISGYTKDALIDRGHLRAGVALLSKPFTLNGLARKLRDILDGAE